MLKAIARIKTRPGWRVETNNVESAWDSYALYQWHGSDAPAAKLDFRTCEVRVILDTGSSVQKFDSKDYRIEGEAWPPQYDFTSLLEAIEERIATAEAEMDQFFRVDPSRGENIAIVAAGGLLDGFPHKTAPIQPHELCGDGTFSRPPYVAQVRGIINPTNAMRVRARELGIVGGIGKETDEHH